MPCIKFTSYQKKLEESTPVYARGNITVKFATPVDPSRFKEKVECYETMTTVVLVKFHNISTH